MSALLGSLWTYGAVAVAAIAVVLGMLASAKRAGRDEQRAKEYEAHVEELRRIRAAGNAKPSGELSDDENNLDR